MFSDNRCDDFTLWVSRYEIENIRPIPEDFSIDFISVPDDVLKGQLDGSVSTILIRLILRRKVTIK